MHASLIPIQANAQAMAHAEQQAANEPLVPPAGWQDVVSSAPIWLTALVAAGGAAYALSQVWDAQLLLQLAVWLVVGLAVVPIGLALALAIVGVVLTGVVSILAAPSWLLGRTTGLRSLLRELWGLVGHVLPGYATSLRRVRRPGLWGVVAGVITGVMLHGVVHGWP